MPHSLEDSAGADKGRRLRRRVSKTAKDSGGQEVGDDRGPEPSPDDAAPPTLHPWLIEFPAKPAAGEGPGTLSTRGST